MYKLTKSYYDKQTVECDAASAKRIMRDFITEHGWYITVPSVVDKKTLNPSICKQNWLYDEDGLRATMLYNKKKGKLLIYIHTGDDTRTVADADFIPTLMNMLQPYKDGGFEFDQFADRLLISKDGYWVDDIMISHFRRLRNANGEYVEQEIPLDMDV